MSSTRCIFGHQIKYVCNKTRAIIVAGIQSCKVDLIIQYQSISEGMNFRMLVTSKAFFILYVRMHVVSTQNTGRLCKNKYHDNYAKGNNMEDHSS